VLYTSASFRQEKRSLLKRFLLRSGKLPEDLEEHDFSSTIPATYEIIVECKDEADQKSKFKKLKSEGGKLRILTL
jgi:hypothetical protein